jgi:hypothetical protein
MGSYVTDQEASPGWRICLAQLSLGPHLKNREQNPVPLVSGLTLPSLTHSFLSKIYISGTYGGQTLLRMVGIFTRTKQKLLRMELMSQQMRQTVNNKHTNYRIR